ncbi:MAG: non-ribosomal peptide synthetase [Candidatus Parabeggiatoa sp. nov. 1]|nr:MAG: non-ribosomal peptide synthetase [Gammaproteobacteria bacterium]
MNDAASVTVSDFPVEVSPETGRRTEILSTLCSQMADLLATIPSEEEIHVPFLEMGANSLTLMEIIRTIDNTFSLKVVMRQFFEELTNIDALATYIDQNLPPEGSSTSGQSESEVRPQVKPISTESNMNETITETKEAITETSALELTSQLVEKTSSEFKQPNNLNDRLSSGEEASALEQILKQQLELASQAMSQVVSQQLEFLRHSGFSTKPLSSSDQEDHQTTTAPHPVKEPQQTPSVKPPLATTHQQPEQISSQPSSPLPPWRVAEIRTRGLTSIQKRHLENLIVRYNQRTKNSKELGQHYRPVLADNRASAGFRFTTKEMLYPIIGKRSQGAKIWDIDDNEYIDITMGFGVYLFGHQPTFIIEALKEQLSQGIQIGPQTELAGEVAQLICEFTGVERVTFCNTGTEAVMTSLRLARTITGRPKVALFYMSFHGHFDGTLGITEPGNNNPNAIPMVPGITQNTVADLMVLEYGTPQALEMIKAHAHELAAVLVEPVQSRRPDFQPKEFLHQLRKLTHDLGIVLIFDEMIAGFRSHPGGAQAWFDVQADIVTYGKIIGGGMPIGVVAGKAVYMDGIDGGMWQYEDTSYPSKETTFFAGTFCKHPLTMVAARAALKEMKRQGPTLQAQLNKRTTQFADTLNTYFEAEEMPIRIVHFSSLFRFAYQINLDLLFYHLLDKGVLVWEGRNFFLSTAHTDADIEYIIRAIKESCEELRAGGFLPAHSKSEKGLENVSGVTKSPDKDSSATELSSKEAQEGNQVELTSLKDVTSIPISKASSKQPDKLPLTEAQRQLWVLSQIGQEGSLAYNVYTTLQLQGPFQLSAMCQAVQKVVAQHEALRTIISHNGDFQQILPELKIDIPVLDFSTTSDEGKSEVNAWFISESQKPFNLNQGPLFRASILKLEEQRHLLVLTAHHIVVDGFSIGIVLQEITSFYSAECQGTKTQLDSPMQFSEYVQWQIPQIQTKEMIAHESYWLEKFADYMPVLDLPTDRPRPPVNTYQGSRQTVRLDGELCRDLKKQSQKHGCTLFMMLMSVYTTLLHRLTGQDDVVVGIPVLGRPSEGSDRLVGYCTHLLPIMSSFDKRQTFSAYLKVMRSILLDAYEHQDYPFANLINKLNIARNANQTPLVSALFNLDRPVAIPPMFNLEPSWFSQPISFIAFDIDFNITEIGDELVVDCDYDTDVLDKATIERWLEHFQTLLKGIVVNPEQPVSELPLLSEAERHTLLVEWNDTQADYSHDRCLHQLFEAQVECTPDAVAVVFEDQQLTYREINSKANKIAHYLRRRIRRNEFVGILEERGIDFLAAMLGILKAGGAFLPIDPSYPYDRVLYMVTNSQINSLITRSTLFDKIAIDVEKDGYLRNVLCLDGKELGGNYQVYNGTDLINEPENNPNFLNESVDIAYMIYTSGSTGLPKGTIVRHNGAVNHIYAKAEQLPFHQNSAFLQSASSSSDISVWQFLAPLLFGGRTVVVDYETVCDAAKLFKVIKSQQVTAIEFVPIVMQGVLDQVAKLSAEEQALPALEWAMVTGEAVSTSLVNQWQHTYPNIKLVNAYGPTEASDDICQAVFDKLLPKEQLNVPIGKPLANLNLYVLDRQQQLLPIGVYGEICVSGVGVGAGYWHNEEKTKANFVNNPYANDIYSNVIYRTGDLGRWLPDGSLECVGRLDHQVKIRGFRIELGEIEVILAGHPQVREAVVIDREDSSHLKQLVAYIVTHPVTTPVAASDLRRFIQEKLPEYMVPSYFVVLEKIPLTVNGKIDRRALPAPSGNELKTVYVAPRTPIEELLTNIWSDILEQQQIGIHDDFFERGGHSLLGTQVISRIRDIFSVEISLRQLYESPTVVSLAKSIVKQETQPGRIEKIARLRQRLDKMSANEIKTLLQNKKRGE